MRFLAFFSAFSDYYPWIRVCGREIIPARYAQNLFLAALTWFFLWRRTAPRVLWPR